MWNVVWKPCQSLWSGEGGLDLSSASLLPPPLCPPEWGLQRPSCFAHFLSVKWTDSAAAPRDPTSLLGVGTCVTGLRVEGAPQGQCPALPWPLRVLLPRKGKLSLPLWPPEVCAVISWPGRCDLIWVVATRVAHDSCPVLQPLCSWVWSPEILF